MAGYKELLKELRASGNPEQIPLLTRYFQAFKGGYGEGDKFWGVKVPLQRQLAKKYWQHITHNENSELLRHPYHEARLCGLFILIHRFEKNINLPVRQTLVNQYLDHTHYYNNWDLIDSSAHKILGPWLHGKPHQLLFDLADSENLWKQRIAVISTFYFIRQGHYETTLQLAEKLLHHPHDLMHKAVGWMLRELGNRDYAVEFEFLRENYKTMPRTMLRYAIEKFEEPVRQKFLKGFI